MSLPPFYFPGISAPPEANEMCNRIPGNWMWAHYEDYQIRICPTLLASGKRDIDRALTLTHEIFHEPSFVMGHETPEVNDTQHCGALGGDSDEMLNNPYCVTKFVGIVGGHLSYP
ncbi:MAG TPA: hypothetical protein VGX95_09440 [Xanthobacteraceae bacterium]|jgi:hypothetical protein|nr:hypothetical protein [Xanthobacteraceae bacterium]